VVSAAEGHAGGRAGMKEQNVIGTMQLLAACQQAPDLKRMVVRSSTAAYGASFRDPAVFTESTEPREVPRGGFARDVLDIEGYVRGFRRRRPDVAATVLRFAPFIGEAANTTLTATSSSRSYRPCSAATHACSSCTWTTRWNPLPIGGGQPSGHVQRGRCRHDHPVPGGTAIRPAGHADLEPGMSALAGFAKSIGPRGFSSISSTSSCTAGSWTRPG